MCTIHCNLLIVNKFTVALLIHKYTQIKRHVYVPHTIEVKMTLNVSKSINYQCVVHVVLLERTLFVSQRHFFIQ